ncbi:MAG: aminotransferase class V-fold PLP-dependent enzyme [bacterium]|nr:aminotransferase class V-fold PLP-dependent enzyme [bacterium]
MLNFTIGPVMSHDDILAVGAEQVPYFRTAEFSELMLENEALVNKFAKAPQGARAVFLTGSGTAAMEASVINFFNEQDRVLVIDGGSFGHRFVELLELYDIPHTVIKPEFGHDITAEMLQVYDGQGYTGFLVNVHETSVGVLYDIKVISEFCARNHIFLVVDSISSFLCDPFAMAELHVQAMITSSQKALACPPGVSVIVMTAEAVERAYRNKPKAMYLDLKLALKNGERGQTPFTPAVSILRQINARLKQIDVSGGVEAEIERVKRLALYFREGIRRFPLEIASHSLSNAITPLLVRPGHSAHNVFEVLKNEHGIWICPNGGDLKDKLFRVGHAGALCERDYDALFAAFADVQQKGLI